MYRSRETCGAIAKAAIYQGIFGFSTGQQTKTSHKKRYGGWCASKIFIELSRAL